VKKLRKTTKHYKQQAVREEIEKQENSRNNQRKNTKFSLLCRWSSLTTKEYRKIKSLHTYIHYMLLEHLRKVIYPIFSHLVHWLAYSDHLKIYSPKSRLAKSYFDYFQELWIG
jgi:hypothetical protein